MTTALRIPCCICGTSILPNAANKCNICLAQQYDLASAVQRGPGGGDIVIRQCRQCRRFQRTEKQFEPAEPESPEFLALCLKHIPALSSNADPRLHLVDAGFIWTEPHSMRFKLHMTVRFSIDQVPVQQRVKVELHNKWQQCPECNREYTNRTWHAMVQVRQQRDEPKKGLASLEQALAKNQDIRKHVLQMDAKKNGFDFYFINLPHAQAFASYLQKFEAMRVKTSKKLVSADSKNNTANMKHTITCDLVPLCRDDLVLIKKSAKGAKLAGRLVLVDKVSSVINLIDASPKRESIVESKMELAAENYYKNEKQYHLLLAGNRLSKFIVLDVESCEENGRGSDVYRGPQSGVEKHALADVTVVREADFGVNDNSINVVSHLGNIIRPGDTVLGYDLDTAVGGDWQLDERSLNSSFVLPEVVLVKKIVEKEEKSKAVANEEKPTMSKKQARRKKRNEGKKAQHLEESATRMGFMNDEAETKGNFDDELANDPELNQEIEKLEQMMIPENQQY